jgi:magnesium transporter
MNSNRLPIKELTTLVELKQWDLLLESLRSQDPADLADFLEELNPEQRDHIFDLLDVETASDVLVELEPHYVDQVVETMTPDEIAGLADQMAPDDAADLLGDLDEHQSAKVLAAMREPEEVSELLQYPEDSAGKIMTPEVCAMYANATVQEARRALSDSIPDDPIMHVYVVGAPEKTLLGVVNLTQLISTAPERHLGEIARRDYVFCSVEEDQEEVARKFRKYDLWVMPVVDPDGRLVGRITVDDIMDVMHEEADEDLAHLVGAPDIEAEEQTTLRIAGMRLPWLLITMIAGLLNSVLITSMLKATGVVAIAVFVPAILAMGGNIGMQSSAIAVRGIALGLKKYSRLFEIVLREIRVGAVIGVICGFAATALVLLVLTLTHADTGGVRPLHLAFAVGLSMLNSMVFASGYGAIVPILLHRLKADPALASGPFVTTSSDLSSSFIYFMTCLIILRFF